MHRLSNGLGEISEITDVIEKEFTATEFLQTFRPDNFRLDQPQLADVLEEVKEYERRIVDAIDTGFFINVSIYLQ